MIINARINDILKTLSDSKLNFVSIGHSIMSLREPKNKFLNCATLTEVGVAPIKSMLA